MNLEIPSSKQGRVSTPKYEFYILYDVVYFNLVQSKANPRRKTQF